MVSTPTGISLSHIQILASSRLVFSTPRFLWPLGSSLLLSPHFPFSFLLPSSTSVLLTETCSLERKLESKECSTLLSSERVNEQSRPKQSDCNPNCNSDHPECNDQTLGVRVVVIGSLCHGHTTSCCHTGLLTLAKMFVTGRGSLQGRGREHQ